MRRSYSGIALALMLAACSDEAPTPEGQVVATVNGEEITRAQLNAALPRGAVGSGESAATIRNAVLDQLVAQQLVVQEAKRQNLDKSQDYLLASRRADDQILSELLTRRILQGLRTPYAKNVEQFMRNSPTRFANREILVVDQVRFPVGSLDVRTLRDTHTMDQVLNRLQAAHVNSQRGRATIDSATLEPAAFRQLIGLPAGEPFIVQENGLTLVSVIVARQPAPVESDRAKDLAMQVLQQQASREALNRQMQSLRRGAQIHYQTGFGPPKPDASAPPALTPTALPPEGDLNAS